jgi:hypothetical protein
MEFAFRRLAVSVVLGATLSLNAAAVMARGGGTFTSSILPTTPPAPDVLMRESFGLAELLRPAGGKGTLKTDTIHTSISGFWIEYPGSRDSAWLAPEAGPTWRFCAASDNANEMPSPLQLTYGNGCLASEWAPDEPVTTLPSALMPFRAPATAYEVAADLYPAPVANALAAIGLTGSSLLNDNLNTSASVWLLLKQDFQRLGLYGIYELRVDGMTGPLLATGTTMLQGFNELAIRYDPAIQVVSATVNGVAIGTFPHPIATPKFIGIEGVGIADNLVVRSVP